MKTLDRRTLLRAASGVLLSLPLLESTGCGEPKRGPASGSRFSALAVPNRLLVLWTPLGTLPGSWFPTGSETAFTLGQMLGPLAPFQQDLLVLKGVNMPSANVGAGDGHGNGIGACLTGVQTVSTGGTMAGGISVDQFIAQKVGASSYFRSLELGAQTYYNGDLTYERISYLGAAQPVPQENDPSKAFVRVFGNLVPTGGVDPLFAQRKSVLDRVTADYARVLSNPGLSGDDRQKLQAHLQSIRDVEVRLTTPPIAGSSCSKPVVPTLDYKTVTNFKAVIELQMDILTMALACNLTRVASLMMSYGRSLAVHSWLDPSITEQHHLLSHQPSPDNGGTPDKVANDKFRKIGTFYTQQVAYLLAKLKSIPEGSGNVLDNTTVFWTTELGEPRGHTHTNIPFVLAGKGAGTLRPGRFLNYSGVSHNNLLTSLCQGMGVNVSSFGDPRFCTGPLPGLA